VSGLSLSDALSVIAALQRQATSLDAHLVGPLDDDQLDDAVRLLLASCLGENDSPTARRAWELHAELSATAVTDMLSRVDPRNLLSRSRRRAIDDRRAARYDAYRQLWRDWLQHSE
jgi:hypothetical protein